MTCEKCGEPGATLVMVQLEDITPPAPDPAPLTLCPTCQAAVASAAAALNRTALWLAGRILDMGLNLP